jgi:hypothetical protein
MAEVAPERDFEWTAKGMSNFDHTADEGFEDDLRAGLRGLHSAWNFNGQVWYDPDADLFREEIWIYNSLAAERSAGTLDDLMRTVNDEFGWD